MGKYNIGTDAQMFKNYMSSAGYKSREAQYTLKNLNPEKYNYIMQFGKNRTEAFINYAKYVRNILNEMEEVLYKFESNKKEFGEKLKRAGVYKMSTTSMVWHSLAKNVFKAFMDDKDVIRIRFDVIKKYEKIVKEFRDEKK